ncbi:hypothetical protein [Candidatus Uabimicrobium amorphum]|uniref:Uncharacterized protein n=1 Tax=Uabimicrobium amorphum TaxID=2596890 RepID=A0A5S9F4B7_UABAM|nr:hypothetical protein [Candidatus Uabimicrobium amorphum]BBM85627.1 hypothetical protein UABAM_04001 [Candidatus Uabimicrobium amorphum]
MIGITILIVSLALGVTIAFVFNSIKKTWLLVPVDIINPLPPKDQLARFRFTQLSKLYDYTTYRPKLLMALILFVLAAFLLQIFLYSHSSWQDFLQNMCIVLTIALFIAQTNTFVAMAIFFVGGFWVGQWLQWSYFTTGIIVGFVPMAAASLILFRNYAGMVKTNELELQHSTTKDGQKISTLGKIYRKGYGVFLALMPIMVGYEVYQLWSPSTTAQTSNYAFAIFSLGIGLNIALFTVPMFREMVEKATLNEASHFTEAVEVFYRQQDSERQPIEKFEISPVALKLTSEKRIKEHFDSTGKWLAFQQGQIFTIYAVTLYLLGKTFLQMLDKSAQMGLTGDFTIFSYLTLHDTIHLLSGFCWITSFVFLVGILGYWAKRFNDKNGEEEEVTDTNTEILWQIHGNTQAELLCYPKKSMPALEIISE